MDEHRFTDVVLVLQKQHSVGGAAASDSDVVPQESFAWHDKSLDRDLKELQAKSKQLRKVHPQLVEDYSPVGPVSRHRSDADRGLVGLDKSLGSLGSKLPKAPDQQVVLLKKARGWSSLGLTTFFKHVRRQS